MCYYILTDRGTVITRSTFAKLEEPDLMATRPEIERFDQTVRAILQPTEFAHFVDPDAQAMRQQDALKAARRERMGDGDDEDIRNRHTLYENNDGGLHGFVSASQHVDSFFNNEEESAEGKEQSNLMGVEILISKGGKTIRGKVVGRKRDHDGNPVADSSNYEPLSSTRMVAYPRKVTTRL